MTEPVTPGFARCGRQGQIAHIANYAEIPGLRLQAVAAPKREQGERSVAVCAGRTEPAVPGLHGYRDLLLTEEMARRYPGKS